jgi:DNA-binding PadR family transcriptional regulator
MRAESLKGHLDALVLAVLRDEPAHGYAVIEQLKQRSGGAFDLPEGTVYPVLHRLEAEGLLSSAWSTASGRKRRVYKLTRRGQSSLARQRDDWKSFANAVQAVLA